MACSVFVSVEAAQEYSVQEMTYDGMEILQPPLTLSENLVRLASKIDFGEDEDNTEEADEMANVKTGRPIGSETKKDSKDLSLTPASPPPSGDLSQIPWESVRGKLRSALNECCVLLDVLSICKDNKYMVLDPVERSQPPEQMPIAQNMAKKKFMKNASQILISGAERLRIAQIESSRNAARTPPGPTFHTELLKMRQSWRLRKLGNSIVGDLTYRSAGSRFAQGGRFEVMKGTIDDVNIVQVRIPPDLESVRFVQVCIQTDDETVLGEAPMLPPSTSDPMPPDAPWGQKLEMAQSTVFCMELFSQLAREAVRHRSAGIPHTVIGDTITSSLFPGINIVIALRRAGGGAEKKSRKPNASGSESSWKGKSKLGLHHWKSEHHNHVLEHSLHQLLWEMHHRTTHQPMPHPTTAPVGVPKRRKLAGPDAHCLSSLLEACRSESLLEQVIKQARHWVLRRESLDLIDELADQFKDPFITAHWNCHGPATEDCVRINISSSGYESLSRVCCLVNIQVDCLKIICRDGRVLHISQRPEILREFLESQVSQYQLNSVHGLAKVLDWTLLSSSYMAQGKDCIAILQSPDGNIKVTVQCVPFGKFRVVVQGLERSASSLSDAVPGGGWLVDWDKVEGKNNIGKIETFLAALST